MTKCPLCGSDSIIFDPARGEYYCSNCGYVTEQEQVIDEYSLITAQGDIEIAKFEWTGAKDDLKNYALSEIKRIASNLYLPSYVVRETERRYNFLRKNGLLHYYTHASIEAIIPALLLLVAREYKIFIKFFSVVGISKADKKEVSLAYRWLREVFLKAGDRHNTIEREGKVMQIAIPNNAILEIEYSNTG